MQEPSFTLLPVEDRKGQVYPERTSDWPKPTLLAYGLFHELQRLEAFLAFQLFKWNS